MRSLPLVLLAAAALLVPTAALAGGSTAPTARYFVITGLVLGDQKAEAMGKLSIDGGSLGASVGCNMIGGKVSVDGDTVTITEPLAMTEMACPGTNGDLEAMLLKILERGPFHVSATAWSGDAAQILVEELPVSGPNPPATAPDEPVGGSPVAVIVDPAFSCPPYPSGDPGVTNGVVEPDGGPTSGSGSGSSGSSGAGTVDSSGAVDGSTGIGSGPTGTANIEPGATGTAGEEPPAPPVATEPAPSLDPGLQPEPAPSDLPVEPAPSAIVAPEPRSSIDIDPGFSGKPVPVDPCAEWMYAVDQGDSAGGVGLYPPKAGDAAERAASSSNPNAPFVALGLVLLTVAVVAAATLRRRQSGGPLAAQPVDQPAQPGEGSGPTPR